MNAASLQQTNYQAPATLAGVMFGRFMLPDMSEHTCQVSNLDQDGARFRTETPVPAGTLIVAYLEDLGRVELNAGAAFAGGFEVSYALNGARLERLRQRIQWLHEKATGSPDGRKHARYEPQDKNSQITLPDGRVYPCEVIDISVSGAAIKTEVMPSIGTFISLGRQRGRVVRYMNDGVGIEFVKQLAPSQLPSLAVPTL